MANKIKGKITTIAVQYVQYVQCTYALLLTWWAQVEGLAHPLRKILSAEDLVHFFRQTLCGEDLGLVLRQAFGAEARGPWLRGGLGAVG